MMNKDWVNEVAPIFEIISFAQSLFIILRQPDNNQFSIHFLKEITHVIHP